MQMKYITDWTDRQWCCRQIERPLCRGRHHPLTLLHRHHRYWCCCNCFDEMIESGRCCQYQLHTRTHCMGHMCHCIFYYKNDSRAHSRLSALVQTAKLSCYLLLCPRYPQDETRCLSFCLSVRLSAASLDLTRERKGLRSPKLVGWKPIIRATREPI